MKSAKPIKVHASSVEMIPLAELAAYEANARTHPEDQIEALVAIIANSGFTNPLLIEDDGTIIAGHGRLEAATRLGMVEVPCVRVSGLSPAQIKALRISDNAVGLRSAWDSELLALEIAELAEIEDFDLGTLGFDEGTLDGLLDTGGDDSATSTAVAGSLATRFGIPPFSVLNARDGWWQDRKRAWLAKGIQSELGRGLDDGASVAPGGSLAPLAPLDRAKRKPTATSYASQDSLTAIMRQKGGKGDADAQTTGTSIFDPVLTELAYRWFSPPAGVVLDPFAGGSVRGLVAAWLGRQYIGMDLSGRQLAANRDQATALLDGEREPIWIEGDSANLEANLKAAGHHELADMVLTCPPYADLEVYSNDPADLSNMPYDKFLAGYRAALAQATARLRPDRFAVVVVGEVRDAKGHYRNFVGDTVEAMRAAGLEFYNEAILVTAVGSLPVRAGKQFAAGRKLGKTHQNVLVFVKGSAKRATAACGAVEFGEIEPDALDEAA